MHWSYLCIVIHSGPQASSLHPKKTTTLQPINPSTYQHINISTYQQINKSTPQHIPTLTHSHTNHFPFDSYKQYEIFRVIRAI